MDWALLCPDPVLGLRTQWLPACLTRALCLRGQVLQFKTLQSLLVGEDVLSQSRPSLPATLPACDPPAQHLPEEKVSSALHNPSPPKVSPGQQQESL